MKAYVILQRGFEYDDEIYSNHESGSGFPKTVFFTKTAALEQTRKLNIEEFKITNISDYCYEIEDICDDVEKLEELVKQFKQKYGECPPPKSKWDRKPDGWRLHPDVSDEEAKKYSDLVNLEFYEVVETEVDVQDMRESKIDNIIS
jgi:hypothetical protein